MKRIRAERDFQLEEDGCVFDAYIVVCYNWKKSQVTNFEFLASHEGTTFDFHDILVRR